MKQTLIATMILGVLWAAVHAQDPGGSWQDRVDERQERLAERAERRAERLSRRAERLAERAERRAERWQGRWDGPGSGVHLRLLSDYRLPEGATSNEPVIVIGGSAVIDGRVADDVVIVGGSLRLGPKAVVLGDAVVVGGEAAFAPGSQVFGEVSRTFVAWPQLGVGWAGPSRAWWAAMALTWTFVRLSALVVVAVLLTVIAPGWVRRVSVRVGAAPWSSAATGLVAEVLFVPAVVVVVLALLVSIVGIPLLGTLPLVVAGAVVVAVVGFTAVASRIGARVRGRGADTSSTPVADVATGALIVALVVLTSRLVAFGPEWIQPLRVVMNAFSLVVECAAWTVGIGAVLQTLVERWRPAPPLPTIPGTVVAP